MHFDNILLSLSLRSCKKKEQTKKQNSKHSCWLSVNSFSAVIFEGGHLIPCKCFDSFVLLTFGLGF